MRNQCPPQVESIRMALAGIALKNEQENGATVKHESSSNELWLMRVHNIEIIKCVFTFHSSVHNCLCVKYDVLGVANDDILLSINYGLPASPFRQRIIIIYYSLLEFVVSSAGS